MNTFDGIPFSHAFVPKRSFCQNLGQGRPAIECLAEKEIWQFGIVASSIYNLALFPVDVSNPCFGSERRQTFQ